jgi:photosystem II stability/assembly factor-like uncharacterized protein
VVTLVLACCAAVAAWLCGADLSYAGRAADPDTSPVVTAVHPSTAPNDLDTTVAITGSGFVAVPTVTLGATVLEDVGRVSATALTATVPWGLASGVYTLTVTNPGGEAGSLAGAFTVTQGIGVWTSDGPYGGNISHLQVNPHSPSTVYAIASMMGLLVSTDGAASWQPSLFNLNPPDQTSVDAGDPEVIYAGGDTAWRSPDGGRTWEQIAVQSHPGARCCTSRLVAHPTRAGVVYAVARSPFPGVQGGILRSDDYGEPGTWMTLTKGLTDTQFTSLAVHPVTTATLLAVTEKGNLYYSLDAGQSWAHGALIGSPVTGVFLNPHQPLEGWAADESGSLYRSTDLSTWEAIDVDPGSDMPAWGMAFVPGRVLAGVEVWPPGLDFWDGETEGLLFGSDDYGLTWAYVGPGQAMAWINEIAFDSQDARVIYAATQGTGLWKSTDGGQSWAAMSSLAGLGSVEAVATHPSLTGTVYVIAGDPAGNPDSGTYASDDGGSSWHRVEGAGGVQLLFAPTQPATLYSGCGSGSEFGAGVCRSLDGGQDWEQLAGISWPTAMATGNDGERVMVYIGTPGGMVPPVTETRAQRAGAYDALGSGVYRYTTMPFQGYRVYLPLVRRQGP